MRARPSAPTPSTETLPAQVARIRAALVLAEHKTSFEVIANHLGVSIGDVFAWTHEQSWCAGRVLH